MFSQKPQRYIARLQKTNNLQFTHCILCLILSDLCENPTYEKALNEFIVKKTHYLTGK
jgi:hypothetical protein